ncbi:acetoin utilization protein AcuC [Poseidonocella sp. HB161398]|uniref:acetoin utilization protein AcuC n=1 Tax=Poseidonocella sp. HB161398 TaxID=2320855 RepID=UPI001108180C|nr:acetoin utilization protein AcuC [Poseidonocella sp. HB161398]
MNARPFFIGSEIYRHSSYGTWHPLRVPRVSTLMDMVRALGWIDPGQYRLSPRATPAGLAAWHAPDYVAALMRAEAEQAADDATRARYHLGTSNNPVFPEMFRRPATGCGAAMLAASLLKDGGVVHAPGCGTHHGMPDRANGFCFLNDLAIAILSMRAQGLRRIAYVDIDAHHPDGVEHGFGRDPDVLMISVHEANRWPRTGRLEDRGAGNVFNLPVPSGLNDSEFALIRDALVLPLVEAFRPEAVILQCGADAVEEDPLSRLRLSNNAHVAMLAGLRPLAPRLMVTGGGGYNPWSVGRLWTRLWAELDGRELPDHLPGPAREVLAALRWWRSGQERPPAPGWLDTLADPPREGPLRPEIRAMAAHLMADRGRMRA